MFGERIKELRTSLGFNQVEMAKALSVSKQSISNWENSNILPSIDMLERIADMYSVSTDYLLGRTDNRTLDVTGLNPKQIRHLQCIINDLRDK